MTDHASCDATIEALRSEVARLEERFKTRCADYQSKLEHFERLSNRLLERAQELGNDLAKFKRDRSSMRALDQIPACEGP